MLSSLVLEQAVNISSENVFGCFVLYPICVIPQAYRQNESLPDLDVEFPPVSRDRILKVYMDYGKMLKDHLTDPRFQLVDDITQADVIWTQRHYKDFK